MRKGGPKGWMKGGAAGLPSHRVTKRGKRSRLRVGVRLDEHTWLHLPPLLVCWISRVPALVSPCHGMVVMKAGLPVVLREGVMERERVWGGGLSERATNGREMV